MKMLIGAVAAIAMSGCSILGSQQAPVERASNVSLDRYAGTWFIIAAIPLPIEKNAFNPVESYVLNPDGSIATVFQYREGSYDGQLQVKSIVSDVVPGTGNAEWRVHTIWPLRQQYVISYLENDYSSAIVERDPRDHVWILSRTPTISAERMAAYRERIAADGFDLSRLMVFPQNGSKPIK